MLPFTFKDRAPSYDSANVFYVRIDPGIEVSDELIKSLYYLLWFPGYFGFNWDALYDCLRDLEWIPCCKVVIFHETLPLLDRSDLKIYLEILRDSVIDWYEDESHELEVVFRCADEVIIDEILKGNAVEV
ncbi:barstar family protein [Pseudomonas gingeri]